MIISERESIETMEDVKEVMNRLDSDPCVKKCGKKFMYMDGSVNYSAIVNMCDRIIHNIEIRNSQVQDIKLNQVS